MAYVFPMSANFRTDCFFNLSQEERIDLFKRRQGLRLENVYRSYFGWMMLPLASVATIVTILFMISVYQSIKARRVSRKCYILILNRSVGDILSCSAALISCAYTLLAHDVNRDIVSFIESFFIGSFWSAMVSYTALSILKLFAVWKPFHYRKWFTMKRCLFLIVFSWIMFIIMISYTLGVTALVKIPALNEWSGCKLETCMRQMFRSRNLCTVIVYCLTITVFVGTVILIRRAQRFADSFKKRDTKSADNGKIQRVRFPMWKLALNVATFAGLYLFYVIWCVGLIINQNQCFFQRNVAEMMRLLAVVRFALVLRILIDPILTYITDFQLRRTLFALFGYGRKVAPEGSGRSHLGRSEYNSSTADTSSAGQLERAHRSPTVSTLP